MNGFSVISSKISTQDSTWKQEISSVLVCQVPSLQTYRQKKTKQTKQQGKKKNKEISDKQTKHETDKQSCRNLNE